MDWKFWILLVLGLWCGRVTIAQINATRTNSFSATRTVGFSSTSMSINATTVLPSLHATKTTAYLNMSVNTTTVLPPSHGPREDDGGSKLIFIIGFIVAALFTAIVVAVVTLLFKWRKRSKQARSDRRDNVIVGAPDDEASRRAAMNIAFLERGDSNFVIANQGYEERIVASRWCSSRSSAQPPDSSSGWLAELEPRSLGFHNTVAEEGDPIPESELKERRSKTVSKRAGLVKKIITTSGGEIRLDDITLNVEAGSLTKDTEITLIKDDQNFAFKSLHDLGLVDAAPRVVEFFPDGLKFLKPADLTIRVERTIFTDSELFIFHGSYNRDYQRIVWKLVTNDIENSMAEGVVKMKIKGFSFYSFIMTGRGRLPRLLSHLNNSFSCRAYVLYRRQPTVNTIDISVVFVSKFVDEVKKENIEQLKTLYEAGYIRGEKGVFRTVHTDRSLELSLEFSGVKMHGPILVKVENAELDDHGFVVNQFTGISVNKPASGMVRIKEIHRSAENKLLWVLNFCESISEPITVVNDLELSAEPDTEPTVVYRTTKLTRNELNRVSRCLGVDWDSLAGLLDIPYSEREEIRSNDQSYPDPRSKAEQILERFNGRQDFCRHILKKCVEELERGDLKHELLPVENEIEDEIDEPAPEPQLPYENVMLRNTPLSSREMYRLSRRITVDWDSLAGLMDIAREERNDIRQNTTMYKNHRHRAEKILSLYNRRENFSREQLAEYFKGIGKDDLILPIKSGQWRNLVIPRNL